MSEQVTKADIEKLITLFDKRFNTLDHTIEQKFDVVDKRFDKIDERLNKLETKVDHSIEEIARLREDVTGIQNEKFEIRRIK